MNKLTTPVKSYVPLKSKARKSPNYFPFILLCLLAVSLLFGITVGVRSLFDAAGNPKPNAERQVSLMVSEGELYGPLCYGPGDLEIYTKPVDHVFFHPLIAYPEMAFDFDYQAKGFDDYFVTVLEFNRILSSMYERGYMLVDIGDVYECSTNADGNLVYKQKSLLIPKGKKPFILSIDDMNYYPYMIENGTVHKLVLDGNDEVAAYTVSPDGVESITRELAIVPLLDDFVKKHPDFSWKNAKGLIGLTGYYGVLGYRTYVKENPARESEIELAMPVIQRLKESGWAFASHSYGHYDAAVVSYDKLKSDTQKWIDEVQPLVGPTQIYIYPFGSGVPVNSDKFRIFTDLGFTMMCTVGNSAYYQYTNLGAISSRWHFDGIALRYQGNQTAAFYDAAEVIDPIRPAEYQKKTQ